MINYSLDNSELRYRCKVTDFGDIGEVTFWYDEPLGRQERRLNQLFPSPRRSDIVQDKPTETNEERAFRRAKSKCRKLVLAMKADRLLTLTTRENITERDRFDKLFVRFIKAVHSQYPDFKYVAVAELQKRGAWHYHLSVSGWQDVGFLRKAWRDLVDGNIDVTPPRGKRENRAASIAGYLTKYMTKAFKDLHEFAKQRYRASQGIVVNSSVFWLSAQTWSEAISQAGNLVNDLYGQIGNHYLSDDWSSGWFSSWSLRQ